MTEEKQQPPPPPPPTLGPYFLSVFLMALGLWCVYDGWFTTDPEMFQHMDFNRIMAIIFIPVAVFDFIRTRRFEVARKAKAAGKAVASNDSKS